MEKPEIKMVPVTDLTQYENNSRTHSDEQIAQIVASINEFGFTNPLLINPDNRIIAGHGRLMAAESIGIDEVPCIVLEGLTESQERAYVMADNQLALNAGWDFEMLKIELSDLKEMDFDIDLIGFDGDFLDGLLAPETKEGLTDDDAVPDAPDEPITKQGDVWLMGNHRLMCGDSTGIDDVGYLMNGVKANICFTSPPYNAGSLNIKDQKETGEKYESFNDNQSDADYFDFLTANIDCMMAVCEEIFYNVGMVQNNKKTLFQIINHYNDQFKDMIYWKKKNAAPHIQKGVVNNLVEFIICFGDGKRKFINAQFGQGTYWNVIDGPNASGNKYSDIHKATFPVYLPENIIENFTGRNAIVVDCFGGTGTTLIAAEKHGRVAYLMEIDPIYCDVIVKRWQDYTGQEAVLESTGEAYNSKVSQ